MLESDEDKIDEQHAAERRENPTSTSRAGHRRELRLTAPSLLQQRYYMIRDDNSVQLLVAWMMMITNALFVWLPSTEAALGGVRAVSSMT